MATQLFANNATGALATGITNSATALSLVSGQGALFPTPSGGDWFLLTLTQATGPESSWEILKCTARSGDTLTIVRAQEGTTALAWTTAKAELRITAGTLVPAVAGGTNGLMLGADKSKLDGVALGAAAPMTVVLVSATTQAAVAGSHYILTNGAATTLTLPANPASGDSVWVTGANGLLTNVIARNGQTIMGSATDLTMNIADTTVQLRFVNSSWRLL